MSDNPRAMQNLAEAAAQILEAAADDGRPRPFAVTCYTADGLVVIHLHKPSDVYVWAQWRGIADRDVTVREDKHGDLHVKWRGEIYDQPVEVGAVGRPAETVEWDTPVRDEVPA